MALSPRSTPPRSRTWGAALLALVLTLGLAGSFSPAVASGSGSISGRVTEVGGGAVAGAGVELESYDADDDDWSDVVTAGPVTTNALGNYAFTGLDAGTYRVSVESADHVRAYHPGVRERWDADDVVVGESEPRAGVDVALVRGASISGQVRVPSGFDADDVRVNAHVWNADQNRWELDSLTWAEADGTYRIAQLPEGEYRVGFEDWDSVLVPFYYPAAEEIEDAATVTTSVRAPATGINATLVEGRSITGVVTVPIGLDPSDVTVIAYRKDADGDLIAANSESVVANPDHLATGRGTYTVRGLRAGEYVVRFVDHGDQLLSRYHPGVASQSDATVIPLLASGPPASNIDITMVKGGSISGDVTVPESLRADDVYVWAYRWADGDWQTAESGWVRRGASDRVGSFRLGSLEPGEYRIEFEDDSGQAAGEYYDDVLSLDEARSIHVTSGAEVADVDATLALGAQISGELTTPAGVDVSDVRVRAYAWRDGAWEAMRHTYANRVGTYRLGGLRPGTYRLGFDHWYDDALPEFFDDVATIDLATPLSVVAGEHRIGVSASLAVAPVGGEPTTPPVPTPTTPPPPTPTVPATPLPALPPPPVSPAPPAPGGAGAGPDKVKPTTKTISRKKAPKVTGKARVGKSLKASRGTWAPGSVKVKFRWFTQKGKKAVAVKKGTKKSLKLTKKLRGKKVRVRVTVSKPGHRTVVFTSKWTKKVA